MHFLMKVTAVDHKGQRQEIEVYVPARSFGTSAESEYIVGANEFFNFKFIPDDGFEAFRPARKVK